MSVINIMNRRVARRRKGGRRRSSRLLAGILLALASMAQSIPARAQEATVIEFDSSDEGAAVDDTKSGALFVGPLGLALGSFNLDVDILLLDRLSLNLSGAYFGSGDTTALAFEAGPQIFVAFAESDYSGMYVYPFGSYGSATTEYDTTHADATVYGAGAMLGYQWRWGSFGLRLGGGVAYYSASTDAGDESVDFDGVVPRLDGAIGLVF